MPRIQRFISSLLEPKANGPEVAAILAELLKVKVSAITLKRDIEEHPDYPSLLSISDVLNNYGIENIAIKIDADKFAEVQFPCITQIKGAESYFEYFTVVKELTDGQVHFFDPEKHNWSTIIRDNFTNRFSGVVLMAEATERAGEKDYVKNVEEEKRRRLQQYLLILCLPILSFAVGITAFAQEGKGALIPFIFSVLTLLGGAVSALLLWYEIDQHNPALQQICTSGTKISCGAVLQSKAAKIAGVNWSSIGFAYFIGLLLLQLFLGLTNPVGLFTVSWVNVFALPYIFFSIYYQWRVIKQWCVLCLGVQGLLGVQFVVAFIGGWHYILPLSSLFTPVIILQTVSSLAIPFIATAVIFPALQKAKENKQINTKLQKLKHNPQIFDALLSKQKVITQTPTGLGITLGNPDATYKLIKVCNPYCPPCARAHQPIENLLHINPNVQVQILFNATNNENDIRTQPVKHLLAIAEKNTESITKRALDDWYLAEKKNYEEFADKYPMNGELNRQASKIDAMKEWCDTMKVEFTPTFFIARPNDGNEDHIKYYQLPEMYGIDDLKYFFSA